MTQALLVNTPARDYALDQLRGIAAIFMVINHFGYIAFNQNEIGTRLIENILFITSFAPVLFFYATGYGMGLQKNTGQKNSSKILDKIILLFVADLFIRSPEIDQIVGIDFFGFISISVFFVYLVSRTEKPILVATGMILLVMLLRYFPTARFESIAHDFKLVDFLSGKKSTPNISYPISPWLAYPLIGFAIAKISAMQKHANLLFCVGISFLAISVWLHLDGWIFFRWGTMSFAYFCTSISILLIIHTLLEANDKISLNFIKLDGIESFLIVPIHYFFVKSIGYYELIQFSLENFILYSLLISLITIIFSKAIAKKFQSFKLKFNWIGFSIVSIAFFVISIYLSDDFFIIGQISNLIILIFIGYKFQNSKNWRSRV